MDDKKKHNDEDVETFQGKRVDNDDELNKKTRTMEKPMKEKQRRMRRKKKRITRERAMRMTKKRI